MPFWTCPKCNSYVLTDRKTIERGHCAKCEVATWPPEKKKAYGRLIGAALRGEDLDEPMKEVSKHLKP